MTKYTIRKDENVEFRTLPNVPIEDISDLKNFSDMRTATYYNEVASFNHISLAIAKFNKEKTRCTTRKEKVNGFILYIFDDLKLVKEEYDENGDFIQQLDEIDRYIANL